MKLWDMLAIIIDKYGNKEAGFDLRSDGIALGN